VVKIDGSSVFLKTWDTAGHEKFRSITSSYYRGADGIIIVYDITNESSFRHMEDWIKQCETYGTDEVKLILVGNKTDLEDERKISSDEGNETSSLSLFSHLSIPQGKPLEKNIIFLTWSAVQLQAKGLRKHFWL